MDFPGTSDIDYVDMEDGRYELLNGSFSENGNEGNIDYNDIEDGRYEQSEVGSLHGCVLENGNAANGDSFSEVTSENYDPTSVEDENEKAEHLLQEQVYAEYAGPMKQTSELIDELPIRALALQEETIEAESQIASFLNDRRLEKAIKLLAEDDE